MLNLTVPWIWHHPLARRQRLCAYGRYVWWQTRSRITTRSYAMPWVNGSRLVLEPAMQGATGNLYAGLHEWPDMAFVLHLMRPEEHFLDIGSNVGTYTVLAAAAIGCSVTAAEPIPQALRGLRANIAANRLGDRVNVVEACIGSEPGEVRFSADRGPMNGVVDEHYNGAMRVVPQLALDDLPGAGQACCWKVDVEGFETEVLRGARQSLAGSAVQAVLMEDRSQAVTRTMLDAGFTPCSYDPWRRRLEPQHTASSNQIWIRNLAWAQERLRTAPPFEVLGQRI
jgi:FkbM family methyltransferase